MERIAHPILFRLTLRSREGGIKKKNIWASSLADILDSYADDEYTRSIDYDGVSASQRPLWTKIYNVCTESYNWHKHPREAWKAREEYRLSDYIYERIPNIDYGFVFNPDHYVHLPPEDEQTEAGFDSIRFTPSVEYGWADKKSTIKLGRYIKKYHNLSDVLVQEITNKFIAARMPEQLEFCLTKDEKEITEVFETKMAAEGNEGQSSCMYGKFGGWKVKPYHIYADNSEVAVAYAFRQSDEEIIARSVVNLIDRCWVRIYAVWPERGENIQKRHQSICTQFKGMLETNGFPRKGTLNGRKLRKIQDSRGTELAPYIDTDYCGLEDMGEVWVVRNAENTALAAHSTKGFVYNGSRGYDPICSYCSYSWPYEGLIRDFENGYILCPECVIKRYIVKAKYIKYGNTSEIWIHDSRTIWACDGERYYSGTYDNGYLIHHNPTNKFHVRKCQCAEMQPVPKPAPSVPTTPTLDFSTAGSNDGYTITFGDNVWMPAEEPVHATIYDEREFVEEDF